MPSLSLEIKEAQCMQCRFPGSREALTPCVCVNVSLCRGDQVTRTLGCPADRGRPSLSGRLPLPPLPGLSGVSILAFQCLPLPFAAPASRPHVSSPHRLCLINGWVANMYRGRGLCNIFCFSDCPATSLPGLGTQALCFPKGRVGYKGGLRVSLPPAHTLPLLPT